MPEVFHKSLPRLACLPFLLLLGIAGCTGSGLTRNQPQDLPREVDPVQVAADNTRLGIAYMQQNDLEEAERKLQKAVAAASNYPPPYQALGLLYHRVGEFEKAGRNFKRALELDPKSSVYMNAYGQFLCARDKTQEGMKLLLQAAENPIYNHPEIPYVNAGLCSLHSGKLEEAEHFFLLSLQRQSKLPQALLEMSTLRYRAANHFSARAYLQRYEEVAPSPRSPRSLLLGVCIERVLGDKDQLASYAIQLRNQYPDSQEAAHLEKSVCP